MHNFSSYLNLWTEVNFFCLYRIQFKYVIFDFFSMDFGLDMLEYLSAHRNYYILSILLEDILSIKSLWSLKKLGFFLFVSNVQNQLFTKLIEFEKFLHFQKADCRIN